MSNRIREILRAAVVAAVLSLGFPVLAAMRPAVLDFPLDPVEQVPVLRTAPLDRDALIAEDAAKSSPDAPFRFAVGEKVAVGCADAGRWEDPTPQHRVWRLRILAPGALSVNLTFSVFDLPAGGRLSMYPTDLTGPRDPRGVRVFTAADVDRMGQLWTPVVLTDDLMVEIEIPTGAVAPRVELASVNRGFRGFGEPDRDKSGSCNIDIVCPEGNDWREDARAVGVYQVGGFFKCTGSLINNTSRDGTPLFLTANHCLSTESQANTVVVYWNFESPVCGQHGGGSLDQFTTGATLRATSGLSDFTLLELQETPDPDFGVTLAGWDRRDFAPDAAVTIHHPSTDEKSISFENDPLTVTTYLATDVPGNGTHLRVRDWDLGTTEHGSSGCPLFDPAHHIVGQLHGGWAACGNDTSDWYGRLFVSWSGEASVDSRLSDWLDPANTGEEFIDLLDPAVPELVVAPSDDSEFSMIAGGDFTVVTGSYVLHNVGGGDLPYHASSTRDWVTLEPATGSIAPRDSVTVTFTATSGLSALAAGSYESVLAFENMANGLGDATRTLTVQVLSVQPSVATPVPNPFLTFTEITYVLPTAGPVRARILDLQGRCVRDFGTLTGVVGANELAWNGNDDAGRPVAAGVYALRLEAEGVTLRTTVTRLR